MSIADISRLRVRNRTTIADATEGQVRSSETQIQWQTDVTLVIVVDVDCPWAIFFFDVHLHRQHYIYIDPWQNLSQCRFLNVDVDLSLNSLLTRMIDHWSLKWAINKKWSIIDRSIDFLKKAYIDAKIAINIRKGLGSAYHREATITLAALLEPIP